MAIFGLGNKSKETPADSAHTQYLLRQTAIKFDNNLADFQAVVASNMDFKIKQGSISSPNPADYTAGYKKAYNYLRKMNSKAEIIKMYERDLSLPSAGVLEAIKALTNYFDSIEGKRDAFFRKNLDELVKNLKNSIGGYLKD